MDLSRLRAQFTQHLQDLLALGDLDRGKFWPLYAVFVSTPGLPSEFFSLCYKFTDAMLGVVENELEEIEPNFTTIVALIHNLLQTCASIGILKIGSTLVYVGGCANMAHKQGCLRYLKIVRFELEALSYSLNLIKELETSILQLGGAIPLDW